MAMPAASIALVAALLGLEFFVGHLEPHAVFMSAEIGYGFFIVEVIGDFPEEEARQFTEYTLARAGKSSHLTNDDWHRVHEVRRGSRRRVATEGCYCNFCVHIASHQLRSGVKILHRAPANCDAEALSFVLQVCGGNAGQLRIAVSSYWGDWTAGALDHAQHPALQGTENPAVEACCDAIRLQRRTRT